MNHSPLVMRPPALDDADALAPFPCDAVPGESPSSGHLFAGCQWPERICRDVRIDTSLLKNCLLAKTKWRSAAFEDVRFTGCDVSGADWTGARFARAEVLSSRLTGFVAAEGDFRDVLFRGCKLDYAVLALARLRRCVFEKCDLAQTSFEGAALTEVVFRDCNLTRARLVRAKLTAVDVRGSRIDGLEIELENLRGLRVGITQTPVIAALTGVMIDGE